MAITVMWDGWREANAAVGKYHCHREVVETVEGGELVLLCAECRTYWRTGMKDDANVNKTSKRKLIAATARVYQQAA